MRASRVRLLFQCGPNDTNRIYYFTDILSILVPMENSTETVLSLSILQNGWILNPYDEVDEDFLREMNDK